MSRLPSILRRRLLRAPHGFEEERPERLEVTGFGRAVISVFLIVTLAAIAVPNLPDSQVKGKLLTPVGPYLAATGLDQNWGVFAPDSRRAVLALVARVRYADGSTAEWRIPEGGPLLGAYWDYRWRKWAENVSTIGDAAGLQRQAAVWIAREMQRPGKHPVLVALVTRSSEVNPPDEGRRHGPWREDVFYRLSFR